MLTPPVKGALHRLPPARSHSQRDTQPFRIARHLCRMVLRVQLPWELTV